MIHIYDSNISLSTAPYMYVRMPFLNEHISGCNIDTLNDRMPIIFQIPILDNQFMAKAKALSEIAYKFGF